MKLRFVWVGKTKSVPMRAMVGDYVDRIRKFTAVEVTELRDRKDAGNDPRRLIDKEGEEILSRIGETPCLIALDERGRELDSRALAALIQKHQLAGTRQIAFAVGGYGGLSEGVRKRADLVLALSRMTLTHELARVLLTEQVYRAFTIIHDLPYQK
jgi:23S rRNA (pseudouridine1915-N3)-methyltransferase